MEIQEKSVRIDKWLWAARFFKTRTLAAKAVSGGHVHLNDQRIKPSRGVSITDRLIITIGQAEFRVTILGLSEKRGPARQAQLLYHESEESIEARRKKRDMQKMVFAGYQAPGRRPGKRDRRKIRKFTKKEE